MIEKKYRRKAPLCRGRETRRTLKRCAAAAAAGALIIAGGGAVTAQEDLLQVEAEDSWTDDENYYDDGWSTGVGSWDAGWEEGDDPGIETSDVSLEAEDAGSGAADVLLTPEGTEQETQLPPAAEPETQLPPAAEPETESGTESGAAPEDGELPPETVRALALSMSPDCPEEILAFVERYPEALPFAQYYSRYSRGVHRTSISREAQSFARTGRLPLFIQWDPRWGYTTYGSSFLAITGCGPTCLAMLVTGLTGRDDFGPAAAADWAEENGYYVPGAGTSWDMFTSGAQSLGLSVITPEWGEGPVLEQLAMGHPVLCSMMPGDFTDQGHFIILTGTDEDGLVTVNDPNSRNNSEKRWELSVILGQAKALWAFFTES